MHQLKYLKIKLMSIIGYSIKYQIGYKDWEEIVKNSDGYDSDQIINRIKNYSSSSDRFNNFERDGVLIDKDELDYKLLAQLMYVRVMVGHPLNVIDYGGSIGSTFIQYENYLMDKNIIESWNIIELDNFVNVGNQIFKNSEFVNFYNNTQFLVDKAIDIVIFSGVLQYIKYYDNTLLQVFEIKPQFILIDRTPIIEGGYSVIAKQILPKSTGGYSYPSWIFEKADFLKNFSKYNLIASFKSIDGQVCCRNTIVTFMGFLFERISNDRT
jgi:putative methyltransferase (TIGR04325 family)